MNQEKEYLKEEIRKEFQLERMILFSDAVFAIVITLMAIEIKLPETEIAKDDLSFLHQLKHIVPVIMAYCVSFLFISVTWYQHLQIFSLLKDYDKGLVIRNLVMLFLLGLFPFASVTMAKSTHGGLMMPFYIYSAILLVCKLAQQVLNHYILVQHPELCVQTDFNHHKAEHTRNFRMLVGMIGLILLVVVTTQLIQNPELKPLSVLWILLVFVLRKKVDKSKPPVGKI